MVCETTDERIGRRAHELERRPRGEGPIPNRWRLEHVLQSVAVKSVAARVRAFNVHGLVLGRMGDFGWAEYRDHEVLRVPEQRPIAVSDGSRIRDLLAGAGAGDSDHVVRR